MRSIGVAIPKHLMPHMHDSSTRCLHSRIVKEPIIICGTPKSHHGKQPRGLAEDPGKRTWKGGRYPYCCKDHTRPRRRDLSDRDCVRHRRRRACPDCGAKGVCNKEAILPGIACGIQLRDDRGCFGLRCGYDGTDPKTPAGSDHGDP